MQCFKKAVEKDTKNVYELYDALLEGMECVSQRNTKNHTKAQHFKSTNGQFSRVFENSLCIFYFCKIELSEHHHKADGKQNPEAVANIKQNRTLGDEKEHTDHTEIVHWRRVQWENTHSTLKFLK